MQASTTDGANSPATSSALPAPVASSTARPTVGLSRWTTTEMSSRMSRTISAVSTLRRSLACVHTTARAPARPAARSCAHGIAVAAHVRAAPALHERRHPRGGVVVEHDHRHLRHPQLLDGAQADALQTAHDHMARPVLVAAGRWRPRGSRAPRARPVCAAPDADAPSGICVVEGSVCPRSLTPPRHIRFVAATLPERLASESYRALGT